MNRFERAYDRAFETRLYYDAFMIDRRIRRLRTIRDKAPVGSDRRRVINCWIVGLKDARELRQEDDNFWLTERQYYEEYLDDVPNWALGIKEKFALGESGYFWASWQTSELQPCSAIEYWDWVFHEDVWKYVREESWYTWRHDGDQMQFLGIFPNFFEARQATGFDMKDGNQ